MCDCVYPGSGDDNDDIVVLGGSKPRPPNTEEANILYVAVTRAKRNLILTSTLARVMREAKVSLAKVLLYLRVQSRLLQYISVRI